VILNLLAEAPPVIILFRFTPTAASLQIAITSDVPTGSGRTVIVNVLAGPEQEFFVPVTDIVATLGELVVFDAAANVEMLPVPEATRPIDVLSFVQLNVTPPELILEPNAGTTIVPPEHTVIFEIALTTGVGLIVIVNVFRLAPALVHPFFEAVTVIVPTISAPVLFAGAT